MALPRRTSRLFAATARQSLRMTDAGFFGEGPYLSRSSHAARYSQLHAPNAHGEYGVILYALSVSRAVPISLGNHFGTPAQEGPPANPRFHGYSKFYSEDRDVAPVLSPNCGGHFVRYCGQWHPFDNSMQPHVVL